MIGEALLESVTDATNVSPCLGVGNVVYVSTDAAVTTVVGIVVVSVGVVGGGDGVGAAATGVGNGAVVVGAVVVDEDVVTALIINIGDSSVAIYARDTAIFVVDVTVITRDGVAANSVCASAVATIVAATAVAVGEAAVIKIGQYLIFIENSLGFPMASYSASVLVHG